MNYDLKLKAVKLVHEWYDACLTPVIMDTGSLDLLLTMVEQALQDVAEKAPSCPQETLK